MAIQGSYNLDNALTSQSYAYKCWYNYNYGNNTMEIPEDIDEMTEGMVIPEEAPQIPSEGGSPAAGAGLGLGTGSGENGNGTGSTGLGLGAAQDGKDDKDKDKPVA